MRQRDGRLLAPVLVVVAAAAACSDPYIEDKVRRGPAEKPDAGPASTDAVAPDAATEAEAPTEAKCNPTAPFGAPARVPGLPDRAFGGRFSQDESTAFFSVDGLRVATRGAAGYGPAVVQAMESKSASYPSFTSDLITMFYSDNDEGVWREQKNTVGAFVGRTAVPPTGLENAWISSPWVDVPRGDLYVSAWSKATPPVPVAIAVTKLAAAAGAFTRLDLGGDALAPVLTSDGLTIFFASGRAADGVLGDTRIWSATRRSPEVPFASSAVVPNVSSGKGDVPTWVSPDGCRLYFHSFRSDPYAMYVATRPQ